VQEYTQVADIGLISSKPTRKVSTKRQTLSYNLYVKPRRGNHIQSDEFRLTKALNRNIRSTTRTLGLDAPCAKLETGCLINNLQSLVTFTRRVQRAVKELKAGLKDCKAGGVDQSTSEPKEHIGDTGSLPPGTQPLVPLLAYDCVPTNVSDIGTTTEPTLPIGRTED